jgi:hypothetical protein
MGLICLRDARDPALSLSIALHEHRSELHCLFSWAIKSTVCFVTKPSLWNSCSGYMVGNPASYSAGSGFKSRLHDRLHSLRSLRLPSVLTGNQRPTTVPPTPSWVAHSLTICRRTDWNTAWRSIAGFYTTNLYGESRLHCSVNELFLSGRPNTHFRSKPWQTLNEIKTNKSKLSDSTEIHLNKHPSPWPTLTKSPSLSVMW